MWYNNIVDVETTDWNIWSVFDVDPNNYNFLDEWLLDTMEWIKTSIEIWSELSYEDKINSYLFKIDWEEEKEKFIEELDKKEIEYEEVMDNYNSLLVTNEWGEYKIEYFNWDWEKKELYKLYWIKELVDAENILSIVKEWFMKYKNICLNKRNMEEIEEWRVGRKSMYDISREMVEKTKEIKEIQKEQVKLNKKIEEIYDKWDVERWEIELEWYNNNENNYILNGVLNRIYNEKAGREYNKFLWIVSRGWEEWSIIVKWRQGWTWFWWNWLDMTSMMYINTWKNIQLLKWNISTSQRVLMQAYLYKIKNEVNSKTNVLDNFKEWKKTLKWIMWIWEWEYESIDKAEEKIEEMIMKVRQWKYESFLELWEVQEKWIKWTEVWKEIVVNWINKLLDDYVKSYNEYIDKDEWLKKVTDEYNKNLLRDTEYKRENIDSYRDIEVWFKSYENKLKDNGKILKWWNWVFWLGDYIDITNSTVEEWFNKLIDSVKEHVKYAVSWDWEIMKKLEEYISTVVIKEWKTISIKWWLSSIVTIWKSLMMWYEMEKYLKPLDMSFVNMMNEYAKEPGIKSYNVSIKVWQEEESVDMMWLIREWKISKNWKKVKSIILPFTYRKLDFSKWDTESIIRDSWWERAWDELLTPVWDVVKYSWEFYKNISSGNIHEAYNNFLDVQKTTAEFTVKIWWVVIWWIWAWFVWWVTLNPALAWWTFFLIDNAINWLWWWIINSLYTTWKNVWNIVSWDWKNQDAWISFINWLYWWLWMWDQKMDVYWENYYVKDKNWKILLKTWKEIFTEKTLELWSDIVLMWPVWNVWSEIWKFTTEYLLTSWLKEWLSDIWWKTLWLLWEACVFTWFNSIYSPFSTWIMDFVNEWDIWKAFDSFWEELKKNMDWGRIWANLLYNIAYIWILRKANKVWEWIWEMIIDSWTKSRYEKISDKINKEYEEFMERLIVEWLTLDVSVWWWKTELIIKNKNWKVVDLNTWYDVIKTKIAEMNSDVLDMLEVNKKISMVEKEFYSELDVIKYNDYLKDNWYDARLPLEKILTWDKLSEYKLLKKKYLDVLDKYANNVDSQYDIDTFPDWQMYKLYTDEEYLWFVNMEVIEIDETKPRKPATKVKITKKDWTSEIIDANKPLFYFYTKSWKKINITPTTAKHIEDLHIKWTDAWSLFDYNTLKELFSDIVNKLPSNLANLEEWRFSFSIDMWKGMWKEGISTMDELKAKWILSDFDVSTAFKYKDEVYNLNKNWTEEQKNKFIEDYNKDNKDCKVKFKLVRWDVLIPFVNTEKIYTEELFVGWWVWDNWELYIFTMAPWRDMPMHPKWSNFYNDWVFDEDLYKKSADAWFNTVMLISN